MVNKNKGTINHYKILSILIAQDGFSFYLYHKEKQEKIELGNFMVDDILSQKSLRSFKDQLSRIYRSYSFEHIKLAFSNPYYAFIPKDYFIEDEKAEYIKYNVKLLEEDHIVSDIIESIDAYQVYIPLINYYNTVLDFTEEFEYQHFTHFLIDTFIPKSFDQIQSMNVVVNHSSIDIIAFEGKKFTLCNSFEYSNDFDLAYYVLFAVEELKYDQLKMKLDIYHDQEKQSWNNILKTYIKNIELHNINITSLVK